MPKRSLIAEGSISMCGTATLHQFNFPTSAGTTDLGPTTDMEIQPGGVTYITGVPDMPELQASVANPGSATTIVWSMDITSERPERGSRDDLSIGPVELPAGDPWDITESLPGFDGGSCTVHYQCRQRGNDLGSEQTFSFFIRGKNPRDAAAKTYIQSIAGALRFLWAIVQHESRQGNRIYNEFNTGALAELPNFGAPDGWGISQIEGANTAQVYDWSANVQAALAILQSKNAAQQRFFDAVARTFPNDADAPHPPASFTPPGTSTSMTALEAGATTLYNGAGGCPTETLLDQNNQMVTFQNPWHFTPTVPSAQKWSYTPNSNNYLFRVIFDEFEGHLPSQE
jgi:hypothetical protein